MVKKLPANAGDIRDSGLIPGLESRKWQPIPVFLPEKFHRQRSLEGHSLWGCQESDMIEHRATHTSLTTTVLFNIDNY